MMTASKGIIVAVVLVIIGIILIAIGGGLIPFFNNTIRNTVDQNVILKNNSAAYNAWLDPPAEIYMDFYFFNITNSESLFTEKPRLKEMGPYVYRELRTKSDIQFAENGSHLYYREHKAYVFDREKSVGDETDQFVTISIPLVTIANRFRFIPEFTQSVIKFALKPFSKLFVQLSVKDLLWGYKPDFIEEINKILQDFHLPTVNFKFGLYTGPTKNGSDDGVYEIGTGLGNIDHLGEIFTWKGKKNLTYWTTSTCNMINGTDGTMYHPFVDQSETLYIFNSEFCRSVYVTFDKKTTVSASAIPVYHFTPPPSVFEDSKVNPANRGFCTPAGSCLGAGMLNISTCSIQNAPVIMSQPHFYQAAPNYQNSVDGLHPDPSKHGTIIDVEPNTGIVLNAMKKVQVNIYLEKLTIDSSWTSSLNNRSLIFPITWGCEHATIPDDKAADFKHQVLVPVMISQGIMYGLIALGCLVVLCSLLALVILIIRQRKMQVEGNIQETDDTEPIIRDDPEPIVT